MLPRFPPLTSLPLGHQFPSPLRRKLLGSIGGMPAEMVTSQHDTRLGVDPPPPMLVYVNSSWAIVVRVQSEGEAKLLTATAIVPDPSFGGSICASSSSSSSKDAATAEQTVEAALAEGLRSDCSIVLLCW